MNIMQARGLALQAKSNIGRLTRLLGEAKKNPEDSRGVRELNRQLQANQYDLKRMYDLFPEIEPPKVRQLNLFSKARQVEEQKLVKEKGWLFVGGTPGAGKTHSLPIDMDAPVYEPEFEQDHADLFLMSLMGD